MALDKIHASVKIAFEKDGWIIIDDPLRINIDEIVFNIDLRVEKLFTVIKGKKLIAIEIKSFRRRSILYTFYEAFGQYMFYRDALREASINCEIYLALPNDKWANIKTNKFLMRRIAQYKIKIVTVDLTKKIIASWEK